MKSSNIILIFLLAVVMIMSSCGSKKNKKKSEGEPASVAVVDKSLSDKASSKFFDKLMSNALAEEFIVAKVNATVDMDGRSRSTHGTLRMKRDDVIQLSLVDPIVGFVEVGRMEFTKENVKLIIRITKEFVEVPYSEVSYLQRSNITFGTLQSLFWNQVFVPGQDTPSADSFSFGQNGEGIILQHSDSLLKYAFIANKSDAHLHATRVSDHSDQYSMSFLYDKFDSYAGKQFPRDMTLAFSALGRKFSLHLEISSLKNSSNWPPRSMVPPGYKKVSADRLFRTLVAG